MTVLSRPMCSRATSWATLDTAMPTSMRRITCGSDCPTQRIVRDPGVAVWNVATIGLRARSRAIADTLGVIGSCR